MKRFAWLCPGNFIVRVWYLWQNGKMATTAGLCFCSHRTLNAEKMQDVS